MKNKKKMPTIGHLIVGVLIPFLTYYALNKKISIETELYFVSGSIIPDTYTIIKIFVFPDICKYISWNIPHGVVSWIILSLMFSAILSSLFYNFSKFRKISYILISAGLLHFGLDMLIEPVRFIGDIYLSSSSFYTSFMILKEQDFITIFYVFFIIIPIVLLSIEIRKESVLLGITLEIDQNYEMIYDKKDLIED